VLAAVNVGLPGGKLLVPDVVVVAGGAVDESTIRIPSDAVLAVVEIMSPLTMPIDRAVKPAMYAAQIAQARSCAVSMLSRSSSADALPRLLDRVT
jgi:hypothetical protein